MLACTFANILKVNPSTAQVRSAILRHRIAIALVQAYLHVNTGYRGICHAASWAGFDFDILSSASINRSSNRNGFFDNASWSPLGCFLGIAFRQHHRRILLKRSCGLTRNQTSTHKQKMEVMDSLPLVLQEELACVVNSGAFAQVSTVSTFKFKDSSAKA